MHSIIVKLFIWFVCLDSKTLSVWWEGLWSGNLVGNKEKDQVKNHVVLVDCQASIFPQDIKMEHMSEAA